MLNQKAKAGNKVRLSISNIAWRPEEDSTIASLLHQKGVDSIDVAPSKYFSSFKNVNGRQIADVRNWWADEGIEIIGMQSLLYGTKGLNLFADPKVQSEMLDHLERVCFIGENLGAKYLVFGSPRNRDCSIVDKDDIDRIAADFFQRLGDIANLYSVVICLEPNPVEYGANFMTSTLEAARIVRLTNHSSIKMQLDTGAMLMNDEDSSDFLDTIVDLIGHIHLSEPHLKRLGASGDGHKTHALQINEHLANRDVTIEVVGSNEHSNLDLVERSIMFAQQEYI